MAHQIEIEPLPFSIRQRLKPGGNTHPGLMLDKYVQSWSENLPAGDWSKRVQEPALKELVKLSQQPVPGLDFDWLKTRHQQTIAALGQCRELKATTIGPLTLHLSRASALENAGICLHPIYGFVYLPGSGVKGMSRAWAETVWLQGFSGAEKDKARKDILAVFGNEPGEPQQHLQSAGGIVFHDAWPETWPRLQEDILNSHHQKYYSSTDNTNPPGDWEDPIPVYFLSVANNTQFRFSLTARSVRVDSNLVDLAEQFLTGALLHNGAGAKTASGYGAFRIDSSTQKEQVDAAWTKATDANRRASFDCEVELVTPAFLSGPDQEDPAGCDLRSATLRGVLRAWWRTMHASWLDVATLRRLEAALWGDTNTSAAIRITVEASESNAPPSSFDRRTIIANNRLPDPPNRKTTHGLTYHSFGMDEKREGKMVRRHFRPVGCKWTIRFVVRPAFMRTGKKEETATIDDVAGILQQAQAALCLLTQFGGVGSKSRKGFGSLSCNKTLVVSGLEDIRKKAEQFRNVCKLKSNHDKADSPSIDEILAPVEIVTPWQNHWFAIDRIADAAQEFSQSHKHNLEKKALGLPRNVRQPFTGRFRAGSLVKDRHSSPLIYHFAKNSDGLLAVRFVAFPSSQLPDLKTSREFLQIAMTAITANINARIERDGGQGQKAAAKPAPAGSSPVISSSIPKAGDRVQATLLAEKTKKGGWMANHAPTTLSGPIINTQDVPGDAEAGSEVDLIVASCNGKQIAFRWPTAADAAKEEKNRQKDKPKKK